MNDATLLRILRELAQDTSNVFLMPHARQRMKQRRISTTQVYACLRKGMIVEPAHLTIRGTWKCTLQHRHAGEEVNVAAVLERDENGDWIAVVTVF